MTVNRWSKQDPVERQRLAHPLGFARLITSMLAQMRSAEIFARLTSGTTPDPINNATFVLAHTTGLAMGGSWQRCASSEDCAIQQLAQGIQQSLGSSLGALDARACSTINAFAGPLFEYEQEYLPASLSNGPSGREWLRFLRDLHSLLEKQKLYACDFTNHNVRIDAQGRLKLFDALFVRDWELQLETPEPAEGNHSVTAPALRLALPSVTQVAGLKQFPALESFRQALMNLTADPHGDYLLSQSCSKCLAPEFPRLRASFRWLRVSSGNRVTHWSAAPEHNFAWPRASLDSWNAKSSNTSGTGRLKSRGSTTR